MESDGRARRPHRRHQDRWREPRGERSRRAAKHHPDPIRQKRPHATPRGPLLKWPERGWGLRWARGARAEENQGGSKGFATYPKR
ncbi:hypothetical protein NDU88_006151 [Pleurodeles waltl]|uniref:Uncharacterized protein n=1 Tax=Pleurodeles waltl TaxID=8319 RepID=A0AAV7RN16_PLEWA|nr:hypothetical protein NDU88_006151 [Pleurodeles waltl]